MKGKVVVEILGDGQYKEFKHSGIPKGPLKLPEGVTVDGELVAFGEDESYLHCVVSNTGEYLGVFKVLDDKHLYRRLRRLNT